MDRIYSIYDHDVTSFKTWAKENGYIYKTDQSSKNEIFFQVDGSTKELFLKTELSNHKLKYYPYIDTFKFYDQSSGTFYNWNALFGNYVLIQNNGSLYNEPRVAVANPYAHASDPLDNLIINDNGWDLPIEEIRIDIVNDIEIH